MTRAQGFGLLLVAALAGCAKHITDTDPRFADNLAVHVDRATGCQYLSANGASITTRMRADGTHICTTQPKGTQ